MFLTQHNTTHTDRMARNASDIVRNINLKVESGNGFVLRVSELVFTLPFNVQLLEHVHFLFLALFWGPFG